MKSIKNAKVYMEGRGFISTSLSFDERIQEIGASIGEEIVVPKDAIVLPGFIDQHIHGAGGYDFMDGSVLGLETISATLVKEGRQSGKGPRMPRLGQVPEVSSEVEHDPPRRPLRRY